MTTSNKRRSQIIVHTCLQPEPCPCRCFCRPTKLVLSNLDITLCVLRTEQLVDVLSAKNVWCPLRPGYCWHHYFMFLVHCRCIGGNKELCYQGNWLWNRCLLDPLQTRIESKDFITFSSTFESEPFKGYMQVLIVELPAHVVKCWSRVIFGWLMHRF